MGGFGSGRWRRLQAAPTTEGSLALDLASLKRLGGLKPGASYTASYSWTNSSNGESLGSIGYTLCLEQDDGEIELFYKYCEDGEEENFRYTVALETTQPHFGGVRWWFLCPVSGNRARVLYLSPGQRMFACREELELSYRSRNENAGDRARRQARKIQQRLGQDPATSSREYPPKPKWMHWATYSREMMKVRHLEEIADQAWMEKALALLG